MSTQSVKTNQPLSISCAEEDLSALDLCRSLDKMFPPTRSEMARTAMRVGLARLLRGEDSLQNIYEIFGISPQQLIRAMEAHRGQQ